MLHIEEEPPLVDVHDFPGDAVGRAIPYGVYDLAANDGFVSVGVDHDTPVFAATSIEAWWKQVGEKRYANARELFINADAGGSNSYRSHVWKHQLQRLADKLDLSIHVSHFPPASKWSKFEEGSSSALASIVAAIRSARFAGPLSTSPPRMAALPKRGLPDLGWP